MNKPSRKPSPKKTGQVKPSGKKRTTPAKQSNSGIRLNKYIANSGLCSRREADLYIATGNVRVNGQVVNEMGYQVQPTDEVVFDGRTINPEKPTYVLLNKPKGFDTTEHEKNLHKSALSLISNASPYHLRPIGSMSRSAIGLLLFTNNNDMMKKLTDSGLRVMQIYHVSLTKNLLLEDFQKIKKGVFVDRKKVIIKDISYIEDSAKSEVGIQLNSNRHNIVLKLFASLGYEVERLDRVSYAGLTKKDLPRGRWRYLTEQEIANLMML